MELKEYYKQYIEIYTEDLIDDDFVSFSIGKILGETEEEYIFLSYNDQGLADRLELRPKSYISEIETESDYMDFLKSHMAYNEKLIGTDPYGLEEKAQAYQGLTFMKSLEKLMNQKDLTTLVCIKEKEYTGRIQMLDEKNLVLNQKDYIPAINNQKILIKPDEIILIELASIDNILLESYLAKFL